MDTYKKQKDLLLEILGVMWREFGPLNDVISIINEIKNAKIKNYYMVRTTYYRNIYNKTKKGRYYVVATKYKVVIKNYKNNKKKKLINQKTLYPAYGYVPIFD